MGQRGLLITDLDNTLYDWARYFARSYRAMVHAVGRRSGISEDQLHLEFKEVYGRHGSLEYPFAIQELASVQKLDLPEMKELVRTGRGAFVRTRRSNLAPYPGVASTLASLRDDGYTVIGVTNTPVYLAQKRLRTLGLDALFDGLAGWQGAPFPEDDVASQGWLPARQDGLNRRSWLVKHGKNIWQLEDSDIKPSPFAYKKVIEAMRPNPDNIWVIGDSLTKDLRPAQDLGLHTVWAKYGNQVDEKAMSTLLAITPWSNQAITHAYSEVALEPEYAVGSFADLLTIMPYNPREQLTLF